MGRRNRSVIPTHVLALFLAPAISACQLQHTQGQAGFVAAEPVAPVQSRGGEETAAGQRALAARDLTVAKTAFSTALGRDPTDAGAALGLAETHLALNELQAARQIFEALVRKAPALSARVNQGLGLIALRTGRADQAASFLGKSVQQDDRLWRAWLGLGQAHDRLNQPSAARRAFVAAERVAPVQAPVLNDLGMSYVSQKQPEQALKFFERALALDPSFEIARGNIRIAKAMTRRYDDAVSGAPGNQLPDVLNNVGYIAILNKDFQVADRFLRRAIDLSPVYHQAAIANLDLLARMVSESGSNRQTAAADLAADAQIVLAPATEGPDMDLEIETADVPVTDPTAERVASAATQQAASAEDLAALAKPVVEPLERSIRSKRETNVPRENTFNWDRSTPQTPKTKKTTASKDHSEEASETIDRAFNWNDSPAVKGTSATASDEPASPVEQIIAKDREFRWQDPNPLTDEEAAVPEGDEPAQNNAERPERDRTFAWEDPTVPESIETADLPTPNKTISSDEDLTTGRAFQWEQSKATPQAMAIVQTDPAKPIRAETVAEQDSSIEVTELRAPLLVDGLDAKDQNGNRVTIIPPAGEGSDQTQRFNWAPPAK